jgi:hypothetical protein
MLALHSILFDVAFDVFTTVQTNSLTSNFLTVAEPHLLLELDDLLYILKRDMTWDSLPSFTTSKR